jgi:heme A synthase
MPTILRDLLAHPLAQRLGWALAHSLWQFVLVAALLAVALFVLRRRSAQARYVAACGAMLLCLMLTITTLLMLSGPPSRATGAVSFGP